MGVTRGGRAGVGLNPSAGVLTGRGGTHREVRLEWGSHSPGAPRITGSPQELGKAKEGPSLGVGSTSDIWPPGHWEDKYLLFICLFV